MAENIGSVSVEVVPDAHGFWRRFKEQTQGQAEQIGRQSGQNVSRGLADQGGKAGDEFSRKMRQRMDAALRSLPQAKITADSSDADRKLEQLRANLARLTDQRVLVNLSDKAALASLNGMRAQLEQISSETPDIRVRVDTGAAVAELAALRAELGLVESDLGDVEVKSDEATKHLSVMRTAIELLGPALVPLGGFALAGGAALTAMGAAGLLAFKGVKAEMESGSAVGQQYAAGLQSLQGNLSTLESVAASGVLDGFEQSVASVSSKMPQLSSLIRSSAEQLGDIGAKSISGIAGGVENFAPVIQTVLEYVDQLAGKFESWASGPGGAKFADSLLSTFEQVAPVLGDLAQAAVQLIAAFAPAGGGALSEIDLFSQLINALPVDVLKVATTAYIAFRTAVAVTAGIKSATLALEGFAAAETAAAGASGARGLAGGLAAGLARFGPYIAGAVALDYGIQSLVKTNNSWAQSNNKVKSVIGNIGTEFSDLAHFKLGAFFTGSDVNKNLDTKDLKNSIQSAVDAYQTMQDETEKFLGSNGLSKMMPYAQSNLDKVSASTKAFYTQLSLASAPLSKASGGFDDLDSSLTTAAAGEQKWLTQGKDTGKQINGVAVYTDTWKKALDEAGGSQTKAIGLIAQHGKALFDDQSQLGRNAASQQRLGESIGGAASKYKLTADQVDLYAAAIGITADELASGEIGQTRFTAAIGAAKTIISNGSTAMDGFVAAIQAFNAAGDTAASRGVLIGATLKAANGDMLGYANTMVQAAVANQQMVTDFANLKAGVVNLKTGVIDYHNAAAAPLLNDLQGMQTAAMNAAAATYQHETAIGKASAADDAYAVYVNDTRGALIKQAGQLGITSTEAGKLADQYFGMPSDVKTQIEQIGGDKIQATLSGILEDLDKMSGNHHGSLTFDTSINWGPGFSPLGNGSARVKGSTVIIGANGGVVDYYAAGGISEMHEAEIAPAGAWRVWAEPETGGEAYIPLAPSKRKRSQAIAQETVSRLGGAAFFESGGFSGVDYRSTAAKKAATKAATKASKTAATKATKAKTAKAVVTVDWRDLQSFLRAMPTYVSSVATQIGDSFVDLSSKVAQAGGSKRFITALRSENTKLTQVATQRETVGDRLSAAQDRLNAIVSKYNDQKNAGLQSVLGTFNISSAGVLPDSVTSTPFASGVSGVSTSTSAHSSTTVTASSILSELQGKVADARKFSADIVALQRRGLGQWYLQQFYAAGPAALPQLEALMKATGSQIGQLNSNARSLAAFGNQAGTSEANTLYGAGVNAAKGLVAGLSSQDKALTAAVQRIANLMVSQIRSSLKIHSPSQVFHEIGAFTGQGLVNGMVSQLPAVSRAADMMANRATPTSQVGQWSGRGGAGVTVHQTINPQPGMSEMAIGQASASKLEFALRSG